MPRSISEYSMDELESRLKNHRNGNATDRPLYAEMMKEWHRRKGGALDLATTIRFLHAAAAEGHFVSYGQVAEANGCEWNAVRYPMNDHLWAVIDFGRRAGWPMLSALVVNKDNVETGAMEEATLLGFATAAHALGYIFSDERGFLKEQQEACFAWGRQPLNESVLPNS